MSEPLENKITERCILCDGIHFNRNIYHSSELQQLRLLLQGQVVQVVYDLSDPTSIYVYAKQNPTSSYIHVPRTNLEELSLHQTWRQQQTRSVQFIPEQVHLLNKNWSMDFVSDILVNGQLLERV